jgi:hypothetical protein
VRGVGQVGERSVLIARAKAFAFLWPSISFGEPPSKHGLII